LDRLFRDRHRHAITYNHYFTETAQKLSDARDNRRLLEVLEKMFPWDYNRTARTGPKDLSAICSMVSKTIPDMDTRASIELLDHLEAFYKVAMKTFVDNIAVQVIEASIVHNLVDVFNPLAVAQMTSELVSKIAAESQENQTQRELLERKIHILEEGLNICKRHASRYTLEVALEDTPTSPIQTPKSHAPSIAGSYVSYVPSVKNDVEFDGAESRERDMVADEAPAPVPAAEKEEGEEVVGPYWSPRESKRAKAKKAPPFEW